MNELVTLADIARDGAATATMMRLGRKPWNPMIHVDLANGEIGVAMVLLDPDDADDWIERAVSALAFRYPDSTRLVAITQLGHTIIATDLATGEQAEATF